MAWITDRTPKQDDADSDGEVIVPLHPKISADEALDDHFEQAKYAGELWGYAHWTIVVQGQPWTSEKLYPKIKEKPNPSPNSPKDFERKIVDFKVNSRANDDLFIVALTNDGCLFSLFHPRPVAWHHTLNWKQLPPIPQPEEQ